MGNLLQDFRYGLRMLFKHPGFTLIAVVALALGIGANSAIFSVVNTIVLRPLPFDKPEQLVMLWGTNLKKSETKSSAAYLNVADWRERNHVFDSIAGYSGGTATLTGGEAPVQLDGVVTTADLFRVLGVKLVMGRSFTIEDERAGATPVVIIGEGLWQRRYGGDRGIVGRQIMLDGKPATVVGIAPSAFKFPLDTPTPAEFWTPLDARDELNAERGASYLRVVARLKPGVQLEQAQAEMSAISGQLEQEYPDKNAGVGVHVISLHEELVGDVKPALLVLLGAVGFVLLIACANVANLLLARSTSRAKEIAIRTALGARRLRVMRQLLTESVLLSLVGGVLGLLLAMWGLDLLVSAIPADLPRVQEIGLDSRVLFFTLAVSVLTGIVFGLAPALQASKVDLTEALKEGTRGGGQSLRRNRIRSLLVVSEVALSLVLLVGAGLLIKSFVRLREVNTGFDARNVLTATVSLSSKYEDEPQQAAFFRGLIQEVKALPNVEAVGVVMPLPLSGNNVQASFAVEGREEMAKKEKPTAHFRSVSPEYFHAMSIPVLKGRTFTDRDGVDAPLVVIINETFARKYFAGEDPMGRRITFATLSMEEALHEVVGVVGDVRHDKPDREAEAEYYTSYLQMPLGEMSLVVRSKTGNPASLTPQLREAVLRLDKDQPIYEVRTMTQLLADAIAQQRFSMLLLGVFAALALTLAAVGIFGVMNYSVAQRTHEIGIRMALGAQSTDVLRMVLGQGMILTLTGIGVGLAASLLLTRVMSSLLYGVSVTDPLVFAGVALVLASVALLASFIPARRATRVDPMVALRYE
jgi:putative ABC transport system permease protein